MSNKIRHLRRRTAMAIRPEINVLIYENKPETSQLSEDRIEEVVSDVQAEVQSNSSDMIMISGKESSILRGYSGRRN